MQLNAVNSAVVQPPVMTEAGTPVIGVSAFLPSNVSPTFNLPKDGQRPEDKNPKNKNPYEAKQNDTTGSADELPEIFKLIINNEFFEVFKTFFIEQNRRITEAQRLFRLSNGMKENRVFSTMYKKMPDIPQKREASTESVLLYHLNRPGNRFIGNI